MARNYAQLFTAIWRDEDFKALNGSTQRAYLMLVSQGNISAAGLLPFTLRRWAQLAADTTVASLRADIEHLDRIGMVVVDEDTEELLVRSFVRHDNGYRNPRRQPSIRDAAGEVESPRLRRALAVELTRLGCPQWMPEQAEVTGVTAEVPPPADDVDDTPTDEAFPQVNSHSDSHSDPRDDIDAMANRFQTARTTTPNPQPTTHNPAPAAPPAATPADPTNTPTTVLPRWLADDTKPTGRSSRTTGAQPGLFGTTQVKLTERQQIIDDWLRLNGYPTDPGYTKAVEQAVRRAFPSKPIGYMRGIAGPDGSGFGQFADQVRKERGEATEKAIRALEASEPACEHGTLAGRALHPTNGKLICPKCRVGMPAPADEPATHPDVAAALAAYRAGWDGPPLSTTTLVAITQQAEALRAAGVPGWQLTELAHTAAATGAGLIATAARKDTAA